MPQDAGMVQLRTRHTDELPGAELGAIRRLLDGAFGARFNEGVRDALVMWGLGAASGPGR
jgi:hypothetical protein